MLIVTNRIQVNEGFEDRFERRGEQVEREQIPGRIYFALLKSDERGVYVNMSMWESREAFQAWRGSDAFKRSHSDGPPDGAVAGRPQLTVAEVIYSEGSITT